MNGLKITEIKALTEIVDWANTTSYILFGIVMAIGAFTLIYVTVKDCSSIKISLISILLMLILGGAAVGLIFVTEETGEYQYTAEVNNEFNLYEFNQNEKFYDVKFEDGKLFFKGGPLE